jgi:deazaflavin-dependent oxidoreductase (nitroreductase family)
MTAAAPSWRRVKVGPFGPIPKTNREGLWGMNGFIQSALRKLTRATRPLAMRSAGKEQSSTSVVRHVGRRSARSYETPVVAVEHDDSFLIALPYGGRTDWMKNVLASGTATVVNRGHAYEVDQPQVIPMTDATRYFGPKEQKLHRRFAVDTCLRVHRMAS